MQHQLRALSKYSQRSAPFFHWDVLCSYDDLGEKFIEELFNMVKRVFWIQREWFNWINKVICTIRS